MKDPNTRAIRIITILLILAMAIFAVLFGAVTKVFPIDLGIIYKYLIPLLLGVGCAIVLVGLVDALAAQRAEGRTDEQHPPIDD